MLNQGELFSDHEVYELDQGRIDFWRQAFSGVEFDGVYEKLLQELAWRQDEITFMGKKLFIPRLNCWYGDEGKSYAYSGISFDALPWTETLLKIKKHVESLVGESFNSVLCNYYRNEKDSVSRHSDDEKELGKNPTIASVSFGETRTFILRHKFCKDFKALKFQLNDRSLFLMSGNLQHFYDHEIPKSSKKCLGRLNLTFRNVLSS